LAGKLWRAGDYDLPGRGGEPILPGIVSRILVTGGAGFIGANLLIRLRELGHETALFDDFNDFYSPVIKRQNAADTGAHVFEGDLRRKDQVDACLKEFKPETVIHLGARAGVRPSVEAPELYLETNVTGTLHLLESMRALGLSHFILASSSSVYGGNTKIPFSESDVLAGAISPYAATKVAAEQLGSTYAHLYGIRTVALRFFTVYGPRQRPDLAIHGFANRILRGEEILQYGDGTTRRDYTYVDDIVQGILGALTYQGPMFDVFNLGESRTVELREMIDLLEKALETKAKIRVVPEQPGDVRVTNADISKARAHLGYRPEVPIEEGIRRFVAWLRKV
jgi:UDP-glucuronate 4-epimerase